MRDFSLPPVGARVVRNNECRVVTAITKGHAIEYDRFELRRHGAGSEAPTSWQKMEPRITCVDMWWHFELSGG